MELLNDVALSLKAMHKPGAPIVFANVYDGLTANAIGTLPNCRALATASFAIAAAAGLEDDDLDLQTNVAAVRNIATVARKLNLPLSADVQDGYGSALDDTIRAVLAAGVVGINLEDVDKATRTLIPLVEAVARIVRARALAVEAGVPAFVINARCDALLQGRPLAEVLERGRAYLAAGAECVFVWGGRARGGTSREEIAACIEAFGGRLAVIMKLPEGAGLTVEELSAMGVCRISVGPGLARRAMESYASDAASFLK